MSQIFTLDLDNKTEWISHNGTLTVQEKRRRGEDIARRTQAIAQSSELQIPDSQIMLAVTIHGDRAYHADATKCGPVSQAIVDGLVGYGIPRSLIAGSVYFKGKVLRDLEIPTRRVEVELLRWEPLF